MRKVFLILLITISIVSCKKEAKVDYAIVSGTITNTDKDKIVIRDNFDNRILFKSTLNNDAFVDTITLKKEGFFTMFQNRNTVNLYLSKGDHITINYDAKNLDSTLAFKGLGEKINTYLSKKNDFNSRETFRKTENNFLKAIDSIKNSREELLVSADLPKEFEKNERKDINYEYLSLLNNYENYHRYLTNNKDFAVSKEFLNPLNDFDYSNETDFQFSANYRNILTTYYRNQGADLAQKDSIKGDIAYLKTIAAIKKDNIKNKLLYDDALYGITYTNNLDEYYSIFSEASTDTVNNKRITDLYTELSKLKEGSPSPKFTNLENYAGGTSSLDDFKGKYVYIDVWATWCGPCIAEIPALKKLEKQYHHKNLEFISISIDEKKNYDKWKKMIADKALKGVQLLAENDWDSQFVQDYKIQGIPRFILIDPDGNIVTPNAPRPSDKSLIDLLNQHKI